MNFIHPCLSNICPLHQQLLKSSLNVSKSLALELPNLKKLCETWKETSIIIKKKQWNFYLLIQCLDVEKIVEAWIYRKVCIEVVFVENRFENRFVCVKII